MKKNINKKSSIGLNSFFADKQKIEEVFENELSSKCSKISNEMVVAVDLFGNIVSANQKVINFFGYKKNEVIGKKLFKFVDKSQLLELKDIFKKTILKNNVVLKNYELGLVNKKGETKIIRWHSSPLRDKDKLIGLVAFGDDVTLYKELQKRSEESERVYLDLLNSLPFGIDIINSKGKILFINNELKSWVKKDVLGKKCWQIYRDDKKQCKGCPLLRGIKLGVKICLENDGYLNGRTMRVEHIGILYKDKPAFLEIFHDITNQKIFEREIKKFKFISDNSNDAHYLVDENGNFVYVNKVACMQLGYSEKELLKLGVPDVDTVFSKTKYKKLFLQIHKQTVLPFETINKRKDGSTFFSEVSSTGIVLSGNRYMFASIRDITIRKKNEEILKEKMRELEELNDILMDRELKMIELKKQIKLLKNKNK